MPLQSPVLDKFCTLLWPRRSERSTSKPDITAQEPPSSGLQPGGQHSASTVIPQGGNSHVGYQAGDPASPQASSYAPATPSQQRPDSQLSDLEILHARLSNAHLLAHHQFELNPAGGVSYKPHPNPPPLHGRQPSHSRLPHVQRDPLSSGTLPIGAYTSMELTETEKASFQSLGVPSALCCISREDESLRHFFVSFESLNEGAANAVFSIKPNRRAGETTGFLFVAVRGQDNTATAIPSHMVVDKVLRVSKGLPKSLRSETIIDGFKADVQPLFVAPRVSTAACQTLDEINLDKHLMAHLPVVLFNAGISALKKLVPAIRPLSNTAQFGILLPDMSTIAGQNITFEIKPKWLAQSPAAPPEAIRCRTCALQFSRGKSIPNDYICPLRLCNEDLAADEDVAQIRHWATNCLTLQLKNDANAKLPPGTTIEALVDRVVAYFTTGDARTLLLHLKKLQTTLDSEGILQRYARPRDDFSFVYDLRLAMTLRDCSLFVVVPLHDGGITSKLADLDFKSAEKIDDWRDKEAVLVNEGWYVKDPGAHDVCLLAPKKLE